MCDYADSWLAKRQAQGVGMAKKERRSLELYAHALDAIGRLPLCNVRASHVRSILDDAAAQGESGHCRCSIDCFARHWRASSSS